MTLPQTYLGDGVYARLDEAGQICLWTSNGIAKSPEIALDHDTYAELVRFVQQCWNRSPAGHIKT